MKIKEPTDDILKTDIETNALNTANHARSCAMPGPQGQNKQTQMRRSEPTLRRLAARHTLTVGFDHSLQVGITP